MMRFVGRPSRSAAFLALAAGLAISSASLAQLSGTQGVAESPAPSLAAPAANEIAVMNDASAPDAARRAAAAALLDRADEPSVRAALEAALVQPLAGTSAGRYIVEVITRSPDAPPRLYPLLAQRLPTTPTEELPRFLAALGSFHTRDAARLLIYYLDPRQPAEVTTAAAESLQRLSGTRPPGQDQDAWAAWLREVDQLTEAQWRQSLVHALATRTDDLSDTARRLETKLLEAYRKLHLATPSDQRTPLLASLIADADPALRDLGFELVSRELNSGARLGPEVGAAAIAQLASEAPEARAAAAGVVRQLAPEGAGPAVLGALSKETSPLAASPLLRALARWPDRRGAVSVLHWLGQDSPARPDAAEAALALLRAAELTPAAQASVLESVRGIDDAHLTPQDATLLALLGDLGDRDRLRPLLTTGPAPLRAAIAEALLWYREYTDSILAAAADDVDLFTTAAQAVLVSEPNAAGFRRLLLLRQPSPEIARPALLRVARALPSQDLWQVASEATDPALARELLLALTADEREMARAASQPDREAIAKGVLKLADLQLASGEIESALGTIESSPFVAGGTADPPFPAPDGLGARRVSALVALNRLDQAAVVAPDNPEPWLKGLALAIRQPFAPTIATSIEEKFLSTMTPAQKEALAGLRAELAMKATRAESAAPK